MVTIQRTRRRNAVTTILTYTRPIALLGNENLLDPSLSLKTPRREVEKSKLCGVPALCEI